MGIFHNPNTAIYFTFGILILLLILKEHFSKTAVYQKLSQMYVHYCIRVLEYAHIIIMQQQSTETLYV